jgi:hypothetical protein
MEKMTKRSLIKITNGKKKNKIKIASKLRLEKEIERMSIKITNGQEEKRNDDQNHDWRKRKRKSTIKINNEEDKKWEY